MGETTISTGSKLSRGGHDGQSIQESNITTPGLVTTEIKEEVGHPTGGN